MPQTSLLSFFGRPTSHVQEPHPRPPTNVPITPSDSTGLSNVIVQPPKTLPSTPESSNHTTKDNSEDLGNTRDVVAPKHTLEAPLLSPLTLVATAHRNQEYLSSYQNSTLASHLLSAESVRASCAQPLSTSEAFADGKDDKPKYQGPYTVEQMSPSYLPHLKLLTTSLLPIRYSVDFYKETVSDPIVTSLTFVALYGTKPIGWIRCRLEPQPTPPLRDARGQPLPQKQRQALYISVLALAAAHRGRGLATRLLARLFDFATCSAHNILFAYAHVWEKNEEALDWYRKRGFKQQGCIAEYYRKLRPGGAWLVRKDLEIFTGE